MRTAAASVILLLLGMGAVWAITGGFELLTSEQARRLEIAQRQPAVPDVGLVDQDGQTFRFGEWVREQGKLLVVDFIYTNCQSLCLALGTEFQQLQREIIERRLQGRVHLLSLSFDPGRDSPAVLKQYAEHMQARPGVWTLATAENAGDMGGVLEAFGVTVIPDQQGEFQHNAALVWVAPSGKLVRVTDYGTGDRRQLLDRLAGAN